MSAPSPTADTSSLTSTPGLQARLQACLDEADTEGRRAADREAAPVGGLEHAFGAVKDAGAIVDRFLSDLHELVGQVLVAGLAYPDPELPDELGELVGRARRLSLATAVRGLLRLRAFLLVLGEERDDAARHRLASAAWQQTQQLVAWLRLLRVEHDFNTVQARLSEQATEAADAARHQAVETVSVSLWPQGLELSGRGRAVIHARDLDDERDFVLLDELTDLDADAPMSTTSISRLLQAQVVLRQLMGSVIRLEDHPALERDGVTVIRPAFAARPTVLPVTSSFTPPRPPTGAAVAPAHDGLGSLEDRTATGPHLVRLSGEVRRRGRMVRLSAATALSSLHVSSLLEFNLAKLLIREATPSVAVELTVLQGEEPLPIVAFETEFDGVVHPMYEPTCFTLSTRVLARRALQDPIDPDTLAGHWLRVAAALYGGASDDAVQRLRNESASLPMTGIVDAWRLGLTRFLLTNCPHDTRVAELVVDTLTLAASTAADADPARLANVLGQDTASAGDFERLDGLHVFAATWLALDLGLAESLLGELLAVYETRYAEVDGDDLAVADICARSLLMAILGIGASTHDDTSFDPAEESNAQDDEAAGFVLRTEGAARFLDAHLDVIVKRARKGRGPLPSLVDLLALGDTFAVVHDQPRHGATLAALNLPADRLRRSCVDALARWTFDKKDRAELRLDAGDALLVVLAASLRGHFAD